MSALVELAKLARAQEHPTIAKMMELGERGYEGRASVISSPIGEKDIAARLFTTHTGVPEISLRRRVEEGTGKDRAVVFHRVSFIYPDGRYLYLFTSSLPEGTVKALTEAITSAEERWGAAAADQVRLVLSDLLTPEEGGGGGKGLNVVWLTTDVDKGEGWTVVYGVEDNLWRQAAYANESGEKDAFTVTGKGVAEEQRLEREALLNTGRNLHLILPGLLVS